MFLYNVHTPSKTFALTHKDDEKHAALVDRILAKAGLSKDESTGVKERKDGGGLVYEYEGQRWSLDDDDDLEILLSRLPPASTPSTTIHLNLPHPRAHFASPPAYSTSGSKSKNTSRKPKSAMTTLSSMSYGNTNGNSLSGKSEDKSEKGDKNLPSLGIPLTGPNAKHRNVSGTSAKSTASNTKSNAGGTRESSAFAPPVNGEKVEVLEHVDAKSVGGRSTKSRKSRYGTDVEVEPMGEVHKRAWHEFHNNTGVRTVLGKVGEVDNVRMLLKPGYRNVYISRSFALKNKLVNPKYGMGSAGYTGLKTLGNIPITVGSKTASHPAFINEEMHFDVVLGRTWVEKMNIKVDPLDQTILTYMESGEPIPCDIVVLKDAQGNKIHIT